MHHDETEEFPGGGSGAGDGSTIVGLGWNACNGRGFRWTQATGMQELQSLVNGQNRASRIAALHVEWGPARRRRGGARTARRCG